MVYLVGVYMGWGKDGDACDRMDNYTLMIYLRRVKQDLLGHHFGGQ